MSSTPAGTTGTPILDCLEPIPERVVRTPRLGPGALACLFVLIAVLSFTLHSYSPDYRSGLASLRNWISPDAAQGSSGLWMLSLVLSLVVAVPAAVVVHEVGHVVGGLCAGLRFESLHVGRLHVDRSLRVSFRGTTPGYLGGAVLHPVTRERLRARMAVMVLAGPGANLLSGAAALLFLPSGVLASAFVGVSLFLAVSALLPIRDAFSVRDGCRLWMLFRHRPAGDRWLAIAYLGAALRGGAMPETWPAETVEDAVAHVDDSSDTVLGHALAFSAALHRKDDRRAALMLETCLRHVGRAPALRGPLASDAAVFQARRRGRVDLAQLWLARVPDAPVWLRQRVEAAILEAQGDQARVLEKLDEHEASIRALPDAAQREILLRFLERWRSELRASAADAGVASPTAPACPPSGPVGVDATT